MDAMHWWDRRVDVLAQECVDPNARQRPPGVKFVPGAVPYPVHRLELDECERVWRSARAVELFDELEASVKALNVWADGLARRNDVRVYLQQTRPLRDSIAEKLPAELQGTADSSTLELINTICGLCDLFDERTKTYLQLGVFLSRSAAPSRFLARALTLTKKGCKTANFAEALPALKVFAANESDSDAAMVSDADKAAALRALVRPLIGDSSRMPSVKKLLHIASDSAREAFPLAEDIAPMELLVWTLWPRREKKSAPEIKLKSPEKLGVERFGSKWCLVYGRSALELDDGLVKFARLLAEAFPELVTYDQLKTALGLEHVKGRQPLYALKNRLNDLLQRRPDFGVSILSVRSEGWRFDVTPNEDVETVRRVATAAGRSAGVKSGTIQ